CRYLQWLGIASRVFNVGNFRRKLFGAHQPHTFFDPANPEGERLRSQARDHALQEMMSWFRNEQGIVAIYDATNATRARREVLLQECRKNDVQVMFIESVCEDEGLRLLNAIEIQRSSPDYAQMDSEMALQDFKMRVGHYGGHYETMTEKDLTYIKLIDAGSQVILSQIQGYLQSRIVYYLMNLRIRSRNIYFSRHGESLFNVMGLLGGDSELSARGKQYARALPVVVSTYVPNSDRLTVWTSTKKRTIATAKHLPHKKLAWKALDELEAGKADGLTYEQVEEQFPEDFANRDNDKFNYRYQDGESYRDVVARLEPVLVDLERQDDILIIGHQAILRCLYAYFMNMSHERLPYIKIPLHTLIQLTPGAYRCEEKRFKVDIDAVDTHRPKPKTAVGGSQTPVNTHPAQDAPLINIAPVMLPNTPLTTADIAEAERKSKTLKGTAAPEIPKIIVSSLTTNTFRCAVYPTADSVPISIQPAATVAPVSSSAPAVVPAPAPVSTSASASAPAPVPVSAPATKQDAPPTSIELPPMEEKARMIAEALMQANAIESLANPAVALSLDEIVTPVPEQNDKRAVKGMPTSSPLSLHQETNGGGSATNSVCLESLETVAAPPMNHSSSLPDSTATGGATKSTEGTSSPSSTNNDTDPFQLPVNSQSLAAACV
ncbi:Fructose-2,6-bisphosphatase, partial [Gamsiella multidivaricata]